MFVSSIDDAITTAPWALSYSIAHPLSGVERAPIAGALSTSPPAIFRSAVEHCLRLRLALSHHTILGRIAVSFTDPLFSGFSRSQDESLTFFILRLTLARRSGSARQLSTRRSA